MVEHVRFHELYGDVSVADLAEVGLAVLGALAGVPVHVMCAVSDPAELARSGGDDCCVVRHLWRQV